MFAYLELSLFLENFVALAMGYATAFGLIDRPQTPHDRPYLIENVKFSGGSQNVILDGELTIPEGTAEVPAIVFLSGSGPQDKNEEIAGHKPFLVLSDYLTRKGYAVLRFDDRGVGKSTGSFAAATPTDFAADAAAALAYVRNHPRIDPDRSGYLGHSEGGYIAPLAQNLEPGNFQLFLAGPALPLLPDILRSQVRDILQTSGASPGEIDTQQKLVDESHAILASATSLPEARKELTGLLERSNATPAQIAENLAVWGTEWGRFYATHNPAAELDKLDIPVLAMFGSTDRQVSAQENAPVMEQLLHHPRSRVVTFAKHNHLFQKSETGALEEYFTLSTTMEPDVMHTIADWLDLVTSSK